MFGFKPGNCLSTLGSLVSAAVLKAFRVLKLTFLLELIEAYPFWPVSNRTFADRLICLRRYWGWVLRMAVFMVCLVSLTSCGYRFAGSGGPPQGVERLFIQLLDNKTTEPGVDILITNALKNEFIQKYRGVLVDRERAAAVLSGVVVGIRSETVARRGVLKSLERRVYMTIDLTLKSSGSERIWFAKGITASDTYTVASEDKEASEQNKRSVLQDLAKRIAEISFNRLADDF